MNSIPIASGWRRRRLLNQTMEAYVRWRQQCRAVSVAHSHWAAAPRADAGLWYRAYSAALDAEERACELYAALVRRAGDLSVEASLNMQLAADRG
jgi:hypothetical protein